MFTEKGRRGGGGVKNNIRVETSFLTCIAAFLSSVNRLMSLLAWSRKKYKAFPKKISNSIQCPSFQTNQTLWYMQDF